MLAATLASVGTIPVASIALILGIDRFMSEARALTNLIGNGVATVVVAKWESALDESRLHRRLNQEEARSGRADEPEAKSRSRMMCLKLARDGPHLVGRFGPSRTSLVGVLEISDLPVQG